MLSEELSAVANRALMFNLAALASGMFEVGPVRARATGSVA
jgi:hypothetical protein